MQALEVSLHLRRREHRVWLACSRGARLETEALRESLPVLSLDVSGYFHPGVIRRLRSFFVANAVDILHSHLSKDLATLVPALFLTGRRIPLLLSKRVGSGISKRDPLHRLTYARVDRVLAVSSVIHRNVLETTTVTPDRVITLHDAIDTKRFSRRSLRSAIRPVSGIPGERPIIGFVGRFSPEKGLEELLEAAALLHERHAAFHLVIVGEASYGEEEYGRKIRGLRDTLGLGEVVTFTGFRPDVPEMMAGFDIFAFPSHAESFGVALIEAMALELPVVATNCDGVLDIVVDGGTGLLVPPRKSSDLADALGRLIGDPALRTALGQAARQRVELLFDREKQMEHLEAIYRELLASPPRP